MSLWGEGRRSRDDGRHTRSGGVSFCFEKSFGDGRARQREAPSFGTSVSEASPSVVRVLPSFVGRDDGTRVKSAFNSECRAPNGGSLGSPVEEDRGEPREGT